VEAIRPFGAHDPPHCSGKELEGLPKASKEAAADSETALIGSAFAVSRSVGLTRSSTHSKTMTRGSGSSPGLCVGFETEAKDCHTDLPKLAVNLLLGQTCDTCAFVRRTSRVQNRRLVLIGEGCVGTAGGVLFAEGICGAWRER
jgi:hypothetical protein